jgi:hypothetical protein
MNNNYAVIITTINHPTEAVNVIAENSDRLNAEFVIIGDSKSPSDFKLDGANYLNLDAQLNSGFEFAKLVSNGKWVNAYRYFTDVNIWPRGLPLERVLDTTDDIGTATSGTFYCPIQQGLADDNPDVDAIYRLVLPLPIRFDKSEPVALLDAWCPFNSQNTTWFKDAFPLLYLPYHCSFRMTDIWRSFVAQRIAYANGWHLLFHEATVYQVRNEHNLLRDFEEEIPGYLGNQKIRDILEAISIKPGVENIPDAIVDCYQALVDAKLVGADEMPLLRAWLNDLSALA